MTSTDSSSSFRWIGPALLILGVLGAVVAYRQCATRHPVAKVQSAVANEPIEENPPESVPKRSAAAAVVAAVATASATPSSVDSARTAATTRPEVDWESLVEKAPEAALQQLKAANPKGDSEARRFTVYEVRALTKLQRMGEARAQAEGYFERWPSGPDIVYLQGLTGAHPTR